MGRHRRDDDTQGSDEPDFEKMIEDRFDEESATERAERSYERAMFGD